MDLLKAIKKANAQAMRTAVKAGEQVGFDELMAALKQPDEVLALLLELDAVPLTDKADNPLHWIGYELRERYPNGVRNKRATDPSVPEPSAIVALKHKAALLIEAGARLDFEAAVRLGRLADVERMLRKDAKLAKKRFDGDAATALAAWAGAWDVAQLLKVVAKTGKVPASNGAVATKPAGRSKRAPVDAR